MKYLKWNEVTITDFSPENIATMYNNGYVFTRISRGVMQQTRSLRIDLSKFQLSSENRRIIKKTSELILSTEKLPLGDYDYSIGKLAKDFYEEKFGVGVMSAQKVKEMLTDSEKSNFNMLIKFSNSAANNFIGYTICHSSASLLHYSYPFYSLETSPKNMGIGMMLRTIDYAQKTGAKYIYLGSLQRPSDTYKLQFSGLEWFDGEKWSTDMEAAKTILSAKSPK